MRMLSDDKVLEVRNLRLSFSTFSGKVEAVRDVSFTLHRGETLALVGESGCGKTTTDRMLVRLLDITSGSVIFDGKDITRLKKRAELLSFRKDAQIIFQDPYASLDPRKKVRDIIAEGLDIHHLVSGREARERRVAELMSMVGLRPEHLSRYPHEFSGGQRQRIGIARALATEPRFVVCDEPISALDVSIQAQVVNLLRALQRECSLTYLFIAHDLSMVKYISDRIGVMCRGRLVEMGQAEEVCSHPIHPYTRSLISAIPLPDPQGERARRRIPYQPAPGDLDGTLQEVQPGHWALV